ncbi:MAG: DUF3868 domain-containing protein [Bacteroidales bacterium]|nr:DUF3868 domain-containing protein [Bacteroidales bacterium]
MRRIFTLTLLLAASVGVMQAQTANNVVLEKDGTMIHVKMDLDMQSVKPGANETVVVTPQIRNGARVKDLQPVGLYSHNQWYYYERSGRNASGKGNELRYRGRIPATVTYETRVPYESWMQGATLSLQKKVQSCCGKDKDQASGRTLALLTEESDITPVEVVVKETHDTLVVEVPVVKSLSGRAFVDYAVNATEIDPTYHSNARELGFLRASIDSVSQVSGARIRKIWIKGYASPEGPYKANQTLALARTRAVKEYVAKAYGLSDDVFELECEPENWEGLREFVEASSLSGKAGMLEIIDSARQPDDKEYLLKTQFPRAWDTLRTECLPFLRRTDYKVEYEIIENK